EVEARGKDATADRDVWDGLRGANLRSVNWAVKKGELKIVASIRRTAAIVEFSLISKSGLLCLRCKQTRTNDHKAYQAKNQMLFHHSVLTLCVQAEAQPNALSIVNSSFIPLRESCITIGSSNLDRFARMVEDEIGFGMYQKERIVRCVK